jgi:hypothetical protein
VFSVLHLFTDRLAYLLMTVDLNTGSLAVGLLF